MASESSCVVGWFIRVSWCFHALLIYFGVLLASRWKMFKRILGVGAVRKWPVLATKPS
jgi:hypothetical protein